MAKEVTQEMIDEFRAFLSDTPKYNIVEPEENDDDTLRLALQDAIQHIDRIPPQIDLTLHWDNISQLVYRFAWVKLVEMLLLRYARNLALPPGGSFPTVEANRLQVYRQLLAELSPLIYHEIKEYKTSINVLDGFGGADWCDGIDPCDSSLE